MEEPNSQKNQFLQKTKRCFCILKLGLISYPIPEIHGKVQHIMKNKRPHHQSDSKSLLLTEAKTKIKDIRKYQEILKKKQVKGTHIAYALYTSAKVTFSGSPPSLNSAYASRITGLESKPT